ncbi:macro domain-containing protein [Vibrio splendidus]|nr:macro domain-containing protein [Vibrio splendidus]MCC4881540.1 macro domain-containing protein [Vibrio splendidus]
MDYLVVDGDLLEQDVDVIVNAWNRNILPWWLLIPQGVSGAIKKKAGCKPFSEVGKLGAIPLGEARLTSSGRLPYKGIIHVAGINMLWRSSPYSISESTKSAIELAVRNKFRSIAIPVIGAGSGGFSEDDALDVIKKTISSMGQADITIKLVKYKHN